MPPKPPPTQNAPVLSRKFRLNKVFSSKESIKHKMSKTL